MKWYENEPELQYLWGLEFKNPKLTLIETEFLDTKPWLFEQYSKLVDMIITSKIK